MTTLKKHLEEYEKIAKQHKQVGEKAAKKHVSSAEYRYWKGVILMGLKVKYSVSYQNENLQYCPLLEASS